MKKKTSVRPRWTKEETRTLKQIYRNKSNAEIGRILGRKTSSIVFKAHRMGLAKGPMRLKQMGKQNIAKRWGKKEKLTEHFCEKCGCTESRACLGGCAWDPNFRRAGRFVCTRCSERRSKKCPHLAHGQHGGNPVTIPKTEAELLAAGYRLAGTAHCKGCKALIEWWLTPNGKRMPLDKTTFEPHFSTCPKADQFRKKR